MNPCHKTMGLGGGFLLDSVLGGVEIAGVVKCLATITALMVIGCSGIVYRDAGGVVVSRVDVGRNVVREEMTAGGGFRWVVEGQDEVSGVLGIVRSRERTEAVQGVVRELNGAGAVTEAVRRIE